MDWVDLGKKITQVGLTTLGTVVGGPAGAAIGGMLGKAIFGNDTEVTPEKILDVLGNPETILKMKQFELDHQLELQKLAIEQERMRLADIASARNREVETTRATGKRDINLYALAWVLVVGFFSLVATLIFFPLPPDSSGVIFMLFGALSSGFGAVTQYFFGSSRGSEEKNLLLARATDK